LREGKSYAVGEATILGLGGLGFAWALGDDEVVKIYHAGLNGGDPRPFIQEEWDTHQALNEVPDAPTPKLLACRFSLPDEHHGMVGWAAYTRIPGRHLTFEDDKADSERGVRGAQFALAAVDFEKALAAASLKPSCWKRNTFDVAFLHFQQAGVIPSADDRKLLEDLRDYLEREGATTSQKRYLHGDLHEGNALFDPATGILRLFDPSVKFDYPESNVRYHLPHDRNFVKAFVKTYAEKTGLVLNEKMIWAFGALSKMRTALVKKDDAAARDAQLCLDQVTAADPTWRLSANSALLTPQRPGLHAGQPSQTGTLKR
jgi:Ser/Thr protein kinase RdoA (MazF antagonist)